MAVASISGTVRPQWLALGTLSRPNTNQQGTTPPERRLLSQGLLLILDTRRVVERIMWDRYDPRSDDRDRNGWDRNLGGRGGSSERARSEDRDPRDVFTRDLDLPRGPERRPVRERDRVYEIDGTESRMLGTIGAFRVVSESDLHDLRDESSNPRSSVPHLEDEGLIRRSPLSSDDRAVVLTERGRDLLEANRYERPERTYEPRQTFYAGLRNPRELTHDTKVYRAYQRTEERLRGQGGACGASFSTTS